MRAGATRVQGLGTSVFTEMSRLAASTGAVNLGQGFPDEDGPAAVLEAAVDALRAGHNQYAPGRGVPALRQAIAAHQRRRYGLEIDPDEGVLVTFGATEALSAAILALCDPGAEVVGLAPAYDAYAAAARFAGAAWRSVALRPPDFALDPDALRAAITPRTRVLLLNSPHNPTGRVLGAGELEAVAALCREHDLVALTDEVYEHLVYDGEHVPLATLPGMAGRTLTISSLAKTFSLTGWKVGWVSGPPELVRAVSAVKEYTSFAGGTPFQHAAAVALETGWPQVDALRERLEAKRNRLCAGLEAAGFGVHRPAGTYFTCADVRPLGEEDGEAFCRALPGRAGVVAVPCAGFPGGEQASRSLVRFAFCKSDAVLDEAVRRLGALAGVAI